MTNKTMQENNTTKEKGKLNMTANKTEMSALEKLREIENEFNSIFEKRDAELQSFATELDRAEEDYQKALDAIKVAEQNINIDEIIKAENQRDKSKKEVSLLERKIKTFDNLPLIKETEYKEFNRRINEIVTEENENGKEQLAKMMKEMGKIRDEFEPVINETNELLKTLQFKLLKDDASISVSNGKRVQMARLVNKYDDYSLIHTIEKTINQPLNQKIMSKY